jgi:hypothetical protein
MLIYRIILKEVLKLNIYMRIGSYLWMAQFIVGDP